MLFNADEYLKSMHGEFMLEYFKYLNLFNYVVIAVFIFMFYKNYRAISTITSTKQLMKDILKTRKTVKYYVWYNLGMIVISMILGFILAFRILTCNHSELSCDLGSISTAFCIQIRAESFCPINSYNVPKLAAVAGLYERSACFPEH